MEDILDICAMPESEAIELIELLQSLGVIALDSTPTERADLPLTPR